MKKRQYEAHPLLLLALLLPDLPLAQLICLRQSLPETTTFPFPRRLPANRLLLHYRDVRPRPLLLDLLQYL